LARACATAAVAAAALERAGASPEMAGAAAAALVYADASGLATHGLSRLGLYCGHLRSGRTNGRAQPSIRHDQNACCLIDAGGGLAYLALARAAAEAVARARRFGLGLAGVTNSHHAGAMAYHLRPLADEGMLGLAFSNSPAAINAWGGRRPLYGTNPIAAVVPRAMGAPLVVDLSLTEVVRGKIMLYAAQGKPIPPGWALDRDGNPTTDAKAALTGSLAPIGGAKGAALALLVEILCCALTGAALGFENDSYFEPGNRPRIGHTLLAIDPAAMAGREVFLERVEALVAAMAADAGVRLPGARRDAAFVRAQAEGVEIPQALADQIAELAGARAA
jgi:(2R)-3-sulfolactate dehydrogenase (NADP+)